HQYFDYVRRTGIPEKPEIGANMTQLDAEDIVKEIAAETNAPVDLVLKMYAQTWDAYSDGARVMDYLAVLVARRVREDLRSNRKRQQ
ncbi:DUF3562 domain-containing protein, partial [Paraburkholderia sp. J8-2]|uniref:DUF3562 domain-containing protein n=1 Tax=Paraburkholderia sp. J8-2 TaxID=2805440 RepID=UPI0039EFF461